jgi:hypothetical protein
MDDEEPMKRFQMKPHNVMIERETPPWICMEFSHPTERRDLAALAADGFSQVRTWETTQGGTATASNTGQRLTYSDGTDYGTRKLEQREMKDFKHEYQLVDDSGNPIQEPSEADLTKIRQFRRGIVCLFSLFNFLIFVVVIGYGLFRLYVWSCYRQFTWLTMAKLNQQPFPISDANLHALVDQCHKLTDGTGAAPGTACKPNPPQVLSVCNTLPDNNRPEALTGVVYQWFGVKIKGVPCFHGMCELRDKLVVYDPICFGGAICLVLLSCILKMVANWCVGLRKRSLQKKQADDFKKTKATISVGGAV